MTCQAKDPSPRWPYISKCGNDAVKLEVFIEPLDESLDLCRDHFMIYLSSLSLEKARDFIFKYGEP